MKTLLDFIAKYESRGDYNIVWGKIRGGDKPPRPLVDMSIGEVLDWQDSIDRKYMSEAAGRYQIMEDTLRDLVDSEFPKSRMFDEVTQDELAVKLMIRRGLKRYLNDELSAEGFANNIAKEWASMPVVTDTYRGNLKVQRGSSYYAGDGLNKAHADPDEFLKAIKSIKNNKKPISKVKVDERVYTLEELIDWIRKING